MAAAVDAIQKMTNFSFKYIVVLVLFHFIIAAKGHADLENDEFILHRGKRESEDGKNGSHYDTGGGKTTLPPTESTGTTQQPNPVVTTKRPEVTTELTSTTTQNVTPKETVAPNPTSTAAPKDTSEKAVTTASPITTAPVAIANKTNTTTTLPKTTAPSSTAGKAGTTVAPDETTTTNGTATPTSTKLPGTTVLPGTTSSTVAPKEVDKRYYKLSIQKEDFVKYWVDIEKDPKFKDTYKPEQYKAIVRSKAMNVTLPWPIIYYGHKVQNVTLASGGFIHTNPFTKSSLTVAQNIAPLMSDLTRSSSNNTESGIFMVNNANITVFEWRGMEQYHQHKNPNGSEVNGTFTFQLQLTRNGTIRFLYKSHPIPVSDISRDFHDVKAGLSDGFFGKDKSGNEILVQYDTIDVSDHLQDGVVITFIPKPTCIQASTCDTCMKVPYFECRWCAELKRCSDGFDRHRQAWLESKCSKEAPVSTCNKTPAAKTTREPTTKKPGAKTVKPQVKPTKRPKPSKVPCVDDGTGNCKPSMAAPAKGSGRTNVGAIVAVFLFVFIVLGTGGWFWYAYKNPTSSSGMCLMTAKTSCCKKGRVSRSSKDYQAFMESDTESLPL